MQLELFNEDFIRIGKISQYSYVSYEHATGSYGKFMIDCVRTEGLLNILQEVEYILFEGSHVGVLNHEVVESIEASNEIVLKGNMLKSILSYRTLFPQFSETLTPIEMLKKLVSDSFINNPNPDKNEPRMRIEDSIHEETENEEKITLQVTGSDVFTQCKKISSTHSVFFDVVATLQSYDEQQDHPANIQEFTFTTRRQRDLSIGNPEGNRPVVFSYSLSNIESGKFEESKENYKNIAFVAGEGSSSDRMIQYVSDSPITMPSDEWTISLMHMESLSDEVERDFTMTQGTEAKLTNQNTRFGSKNGFLSSESTSAYFQFTNPAYPASDLTWEWWEYRLSPYSGSSGIPYAICTDTSANIYGARLMGDSSDQEYFVSQIGTGSSSTNLVPANTPSGTKIYNKWVHRAVVLEWVTNVDGTCHLEAKFYENGKLFNKYIGANRNSPVAVYKSTNGFIGKHNGGKGAVMYIEEIRISNVARYIGDIYSVPTMPFNVKESVRYKIPTGLKRRELFIDARDLQSKDDNDKALTPQEYKNLLLLRGLDKLEDYIIIRNVTAVISEQFGKHYTYGVDYLEGDIVTIILEPLGVQVKLPIAKVTKSQQGSLRYLDIEFGDVKNFIRSQLRKENLL